jgi:hypothetical protein
LDIDNTPDEFEIANLKELISVLDGLRESWGSPILVTSGYRCRVLNQAVGGAKRSAHICGYAADLVPSNGLITAFKGFCLNYFQDADYDELILETKGESEWVHFAYKSIDGLQRGKCYDSKQTTI